MRRMDRVLIFDILGLVLVLAEEAILDLRKVTNWLEHGRIILSTVGRRVAAQLHFALMLCCLTLTFF